MTVRHLEQIEEVDQPGKSSRFATWFLASSGGAAVVVACVMMATRTSRPAQATLDPLAELVAAQRPQGQAADEVDGRELKFPSMLSDATRSTTAYAAVKDARGRLLTQAPAASSPEGLAPPPATDRLPVVPLPAGTLLSATPITTQPKDSLSQLALTTSTVDESGELAPAGAEGGFQIQVASFRSLEDADNFVMSLRRRGHRALRQAAYVPERGLWHRVRIGPFKSKYEASAYRAKLEQQERVSAFVVDPDKVKQAEEVRSAKLAVRLREDQKKNRQ